MWARVNNGSQIPMVTQVGLIWNCSIVFLSWIKPGWSFYKLCIQQGSTQQIFFIIVKVHFLHQHFYNSKLFSKHCIYGIYNYLFSLHIFSISFGQLLISRNDRLYSRTLESFNCLSTHVLYSCNISILIIIIIPLYTS